MGNNCQHCFCYPSEKESALKGKNFFSLTANPFSEGAWCTGKQTGHQYDFHQTWYVHRHYGELIWDC